MCTSINPKRHLFCPLEIAADMVAEGNGRVDESTAPREDGEQTSAQDNKPASDKHSLEHKWTLWFDNPSGKQKQDSWGSSLRSVYTFDTVEDFWWCAVACEYMRDNAFDMYVSVLPCFAACTITSSPLAG